MSDKPQTTENKIHKLIIVGSGSAGYTAAIYAARSAMDPILFTGIQIGGQLTITTDVENYPGFPNGIQGPELMEMMKEHAIHAGTLIIQETVEKVEQVNINSVNAFKITAETGTFLAHSVIIATGASAKWLGVPGEKKLLGYGVSGCATCDAPFFKNKIVAVVGGGNSAAEEALHLTHYANKVYLIHRRDSLRAEKVLQSRLFSNPKIQLIWNHSIQEILGDTKLQAAILVSTLDSSVQKLDLDGLFVAIGHNPNSTFVKDLLKTDSEGYIITQPPTSETSLPGIFACGDVQDKIYRQAITAAGSGCVAALDVGKYLATLESQSMIDIFDNSSKTTSIRP